MTFEQVEKEYRLLKIEYINEICDKEHMEFMLNEVLLAKDENNNKWKISSETGRWLFFDVKSNKWIERKRPDKEFKQQEQEYKVTINTPPSPKPKPERLKELTEVAIRCDSCQREVKASAKFCKYCGGEVLKSVKGKCISCGHINRENAKFCGKCGKARN